MKELFDKMISHDNFLPIFMGIALTILVLFMVSGFVSMRESDRKHRLIMDCIPIAGGHEDVSGDVQVFCEKVIAAWEEELRLEKEKREKEKMQNIRRRMNAK